MTASKQPTSDSSAGIEERPGGLHLCCFRCGNEEQDRFRHVCDEYTPDEVDPEAVEITYECLECKALISDWFEVEGDGDGDATG